MLCCYGHFSIYKLVASSQEIINGAQSLENFAECYFFSTTTTDKALLKQ